MSEETEVTITVELVEEADVSVQIETDITIEIASGSVDIIDQDENVIETVQAPGQYQVEVLSTVHDTVDNNTETIIDPIS